MTVVINGTTGISTPGLSNSSTTTNTGNVTNSGTVTNASTISVGNATPSSSGAGITFPATQSASTDANTLDDYEEGTFTPAFNRIATSPTVTYSWQYGAYVKVGKIVTVFWDMSASSISGGSGAATITGLPFAKASQDVAGGYSVPQYRSGAAVAAGPTATTALVGYVDSTVIYLEYDNIGNAGFGTNVTAVAWNASGRISGCVSYITTS